MVRVALDLRRTAQMAFDEHALRVTADRHRGREEQRAAGDEVLWRPDVRDDLFCRSACARADSRKRERRTHQAKNGAATDRIGQQTRLIGKLGLEKTSKF